MEELVNRPERQGRLMRFGIAGLCATAFYFCAANLLAIATDLGATAASVMAYLASLVVSYLLQSRFAFRSPTDSTRQVGRFAVTAAIGLLLSWGIVELAVDVFGLPTVVGTLAVCVLIPAVNYVLFSLWVFVHPESPGRTA